MVWQSWGTLPIPTINQFGCHAQLGHLKPAVNNCWGCNNYFGFLKIDWFQMVLGGNHPNMVWQSKGMLPIPTIKQLGCHTQLGHLKLTDTPCMYKTAQCTKNVLFSLLHQLSIYIVMYVEACLLLSFIIPNLRLIE